LIVVGYFHSFTIFVIGLSFKFKFKSLIVFHFIQSPRRTNSKNFSSLMSTFLFAIVVSNKASFVCLNWASAVTRESFNCDARTRRNDFCWWWLNVPWICERIVVTIVMELLSNSAWIWLYNQSYTSGIHHLSPNLSASPTLSVVGTCWRANGLKGAMALLNAALWVKIYWDKE
jgi:uncharacterized membrane protein YhaH (DUF805 family)